MNDNLDNILEEVQKFEMAGVLPIKPAREDHKKVAKRSEKKQPVMEIATRNFLLKGLAAMALVAGCAYFKLMHPVLYIPIEIGCLCAMCVKYGEWKGRTERG